MNDHEAKLRKFAAGGVSVSTLFPKIADMQESLAALLALLDGEREKVASAKKRIDEIRNATPALLADLQDLYKRYDFTMRSF